MISPLLLVVAVLASARITRLVTTDRITEAPRRWVVNRLDPLSLAAYMVTCVWCVGTWITIAVTAAAWHWRDNGPLTAALTCLAAAHAVGLLARGGGE